MPSSRPNHPRSTHPQGERRAPVEALERRELLANDPLQLTWTRTGAFLNVYGSVNADAITVNRASVSKTGVSTVVVTNGTWSTTYKGRVDGIRVWAGRGNDQVTVTSARPVPVVITGDRGNDTITGDILDDRLDGGGGSDQVNGGAGNDYLTGAAGSDTLNGGAGSDRLDGNGGADQLNGGDGTDTVDYRSRSAPLNLSLDNIANDGEGGEFDRIGGDCEVLLAGSGDDKLIGNSGANVFYGGPGRDTIRGDAGNDTIDGGAGDDALYAGDGADVVYGRDGDDQILALGGGTDVAYGGAGVDSAWLDAAETLADQAAEETAAGSVHRVGSFVNQSAVSGSLTQSKQIEVAEPTTSANAPLGDFASHPLFSASGPTAADVVQGQLGDCWWLSTLAAVAQAKPDVIRRSISDLGDGSFAVRLYQDGQPTYVRVDADLPTYTWSNGSYPYYANVGQGGSIWVPLMEKALAFVRGANAGQWTSVESGWMSEAFGYLGLSSDGVWRGYTQSANTLLSLARTQLQLGKAVTMAVSDVPADLNLVADHAYTVDAVITNNDGSLSLRLRNPWGIDNVQSTDGNNDGYVTLSGADVMRVYSAFQWG